eukprot:PhF_6_TR42189/c1_g2_i12/m.63834/K07897/RAB7A; Ras-related protein Rab-7A
MVRRGTEWRCPTPSSCCCCLTERTLFSPYGGNLYSDLFFVKYIENPLYVQLMSGKPIPMKIIMLGDPVTGKTSLVETYRVGKHRVPWSTVRDPVSKSILLNLGQNEVVVNIHVWDTGGQEKFRYIPYIYYRGAHGCVIVFDATQPVEESKAQVQRWV